MTELGDRGVDGSGVRPQSAMLSLLGLYLRDRSVAVATGSIVEVFGRIGISEDAVRSTLTRMAERGLLARQRRGRKVYVGPTAVAAVILEDGHRQIWERGAVNRSWDGTWTLVAFTVPDGRRAARHDLRTRLHWAGFRPVQGGLWISAGERSVQAALGDDDVTSYVNAFTSRTAPPTDPGRLVAETFELGDVADGYDEFSARWAGGQVARQLPDDLARQVLLHAEWLRAVRFDPHLPLEHLPEDWPAVGAEALFRELAEKWRGGAETEAARSLDLVSVAE